MGAPSKRAKKIRDASEFDILSLAAEVRAPKVNNGYYAWDLDTIRRARDEQMLGMFERPARLIEATRTDYAIFASFLNRLAPQRGLPVDLKSPIDSARANRVRIEGEALFGRVGIGITPDTLADIDGCLANHGVAFGVNVVTPRFDGSRVDFQLKSWPIEFVRWDTQKRTYVTRTEGMVEVPICHGDGRWVVFQEHEHEPWKYGALLPLALLWADHAYGVRDRAKAGTSHGNAKFVGTMPEGVALQKDNGGGLTPEGAAFFQLLRDVASSETPVGMKPFGAALDLIVNNSTAWQIFKEIIDSGDKAADRIYLGHDVTVAAAGGDGVGFLFGVRNDIVEGALGAISRGVKEGTIDPWSAINFGDSSLAPYREYLMPDADEDARRKSLTERTDAFNKAIEDARKNGFEVDEEYVAALAKDFGIKAPKLPKQAAKGPSVTLAPTDVAKVTKVNEARASAGLEPLTKNGALDPDGELMVAAFAAKLEAESKALIPTPNAATPPPSPTAPPPVAPTTPPKLAVVP